MPLSNDVVSQQIITSASQPSNPTQGLIWNELNSSGNLIEIWTRINNSWMSGIKETSFTTGNISTSASYYFPLDSTKDVYFNFYSRFFLSTGVTSNTNSWGVAATVYSGDAAITSVPNSLFQLNFINQTTGQVVAGTNSMNKSFVGVNADNFRVIITRNGNPPVCGFGFGIRYQYIRK
jgi:hypothetical protein